MRSALVDLYKKIYSIHIDKDKGLGFLVYLIIRVERLRLITYFYFKVFNMDNWKGKHKEWMERASLNDLKCWNRKVYLKVFFFSFLLYFLLFSFLFYFSTHHGLREVPSSLVWIIRYDKIF